MCLEEELPLVRTRSEFYPLRLMMLAEALGKSHKDLIKIRHTTLLASIKLNHLDGGAFAQQALFRGGVKKIKKSWSRKEGNTFGVVP